jgi:integrase
VTVVIRPLPRYVNAFTAKGRRYYYFRRPGVRPIRLPDFGTAEFEIAYRVALQSEVPKPGSDQTLPGSVNAAIVSYYASKASFQTLAPATRMLRRVYLEKLRERYGKNSLASMRPEFVAQMIDRMTPSSAYNWIKAVRGLMQHAIAIGLCKTDPTQGVKLPKLGGSIHTWTEQEIAQFCAKHPIGTKARLALELALGTAQRRNDLLRMGRQHIRNGAIFVRQSKTGAELLIPIGDELMAILNAEAEQTQHLTFLITGSGRPYRPTDFSDQFRQWCREAGLPEGCTVHGLRKAASRRLAEAGCTPHEIAAITGHRTLKEVERYTRAADQVRLAKQAMERSRKGTKRDG